MAKEAGLPGPKNLILSKRPKMPKGKTIWFLANSFKKAKLSLFENLKGQMATLKRTAVMELSVNVDALWVTIKQNVIDIQHFMLVICIFSLLFLKLLKMQKKNAKDATTDY